MMEWELTYSDGSKEYVKEYDGDEACSLADPEKELVDCQCVGPAHEYD